MIRGHSAHLFPSPFTFVCESKRDLLCQFHQHINAHIFRTNIILVAFLKLHVRRKSFQNNVRTKKFVRKMLMKLTATLSIFATFKRSKIREQKYCLNNG
jgi:hypothetical protein